MESAPLTVMHLIAQLRLGAGRCVVDTAIEQTAALNQRVIVCVSADVDENWRTDPNLVGELLGHGIEVRYAGDFFHRRTDLLQDAAAKLRDLRALFSGRFVVHAHTAMAAAVGHWAQPDGLIATCHGWSSARPAEFDLQDSLAYQLCDSIMTYSRYWADRLSGDLAVLNPLVIRMGLNLDRFRPLSKSHRPFCDPLRIVTVCELTPRKGVDLLLNAMPVVWDRLPNAELHIVGHGDSAQELRFLAERLDAGKNRICFYGEIPNPYCRLRDFDVFVLASRSDNLPVALIEAMLARLPIIATAVGGVPELLSAAGCGHSVSPDSSLALADGILAMALGKRKAMARLGFNGERFCRRHFDVRRTTRKLSAIYQDAMRRGRGKRIDLKTEAGFAEFPRMWKTLNSGTSAPACRG
jgi:glycosyltransferase involved in cell wall biosynthesis